MKTLLEKAHEQMDFLLTGPQNMNMETVFILDPNKERRNALVDQWIQKNKVVVNVPLDKNFNVVVDIKNEYAALDIQIGNEETLFKVLCAIVDRLPLELQIPHRRMYDCEKAIEKAFRNLEQCNKRVVFIIRDIENMLNIQQKKDRVLLVAIIKNFYNALHCGFVITGNRDGARALNITQQYTWRFFGDLFDFEKEGV